MKPFFFSLATTAFTLGTLIAGTDNETFGTNAGGTNAGNRNVVIGDEAGSGITTANENTIVGAYAGLSLLTTTGSDQNTIFGFRANGLYTQTEWEAYLADSVNNPLPDIDADGTSGLAAANYGVYRNTYIGYEAGLRDFNGYDNTFLGFQAGKSNNYGNDNTFLGYRAGANTAGLSGVGNASDNTFIGRDAGYGNTFGYQNTYIGDLSALYLTEGKCNTAIGRYALTASQYASGITDATPPTASLNTAAGNGALYQVNSAWGNTAIGSAAGYDLGIGNLNTFAGALAGGTTERTSYNTFIGAASGLDNNRNNLANKGESNTYIGTGAGSYNREGNNNVYIGAFAAMSDWETIPQTEIDGLQSYLDSFPAPPPSGSASADTLVSQNVVIGSSSYVRGDDNVTLGFNIRSDAPQVIALGSGASVADASHENAILIGYGLQSRAANLAIIGNASTSGIEPGADGVTALGSSSYRFASATAKSFSAIADASSNATIKLTADAGAANDDTWQLEAVNGGNFNIASYATGSFVNVLSTSNNGNTTIAGNVVSNSDRRLKQDIQPIVNAPALLSKLHSKTYHWKPELGRDPRLQYGLIAQDVEAVLPELVTTSTETGIKSVNYQAFVPLLIDSVNALNQRDAQQAQQLDQLEAQLAELQRELDALAPSSQTTAAK